MTALPVDRETVSRLLREVAAAEVMPRFRNLAAGDIYEKRAGEVVTEADVAAERWLARRLEALLPGSITVGEEGVEEAPGLLTQLDGERPVWIVDPIDGTQNFAEGRRCFAIMVALRRGGTTLGAWIHDPIDDATCSAVLGGGVRFDDGRAAPAPRLAPLASLRGSIGMKARRAMDRAKAPEKPICVNRYRCVGREYFDLAAGVLDFVQYGYRLKPWDHAPGDLIAREAGYHVAMTGEGTAYDPGSEGILHGSLLAAPNREMWRRIEGLIA